MKQLFNQKGKPVIREVPQPYLKEGCIRISTAYSLISTGSELTALKYSSELVTSAIKSPAMLKKIKNKIASGGLKSTYNLIRRRLQEQNMGYSCSGRVIEKAGNISHLNVGDRVACGGIGFANHAEINCVPKNLAVKIPDGVSDQEAAFVSLGAIALQGVRRGRCHIGENVVVVGLGLVGQIVCQLANAEGCHVFGVDLSPERIKLAKELGLENGFLSSSSLTSKIINQTNNEGADAVIICAYSTNPTLVTNAINMCKKGGRVVIVGNVAINIPWHIAYSKEIDIAFSCAYGPGRYNPDYEERGAEYPIDIIRWTETRNMEEFLNLVAKKKVLLQKLIGSVFPLAEAETAYSGLIESNLISVLIKYDTQNATETNKLLLHTPEPLDKDVINVAVIGAGGFAKAQHLPNIQKTKGMRTMAVVSNRGLDAKTMAKEFGADYCSTDYSEVLKDSNIDALVVTTRHDSHAAIALDAIKHGKHLLLEKPLALNGKELDAIMKTGAKNKKVFTVGFNRRYSSLAKKAKQYLSDIKGPCMIIYRVNAGALPPGHWYNDPKEGGGRIIGEACHFFDFFNWFIGSMPVDIFAQSISGGAHGTLDENNMMATLKFPDGSVAMLCYNEIGNSSLPKERIEIFKGGSSAVIDDFKILWLDDKKEVYGTPEKGHLAEMQQFLQAIKGELNELLDLNDAYSATVCTFKALESLRTGKTINLTL